MRKHQSGFTLVEIAIVLVIIGLLLGGVLKGQEMIANGKYKSLRSDVNSYSAAVYTFQDRFHALPGDMTAAISNTQLGLNAGGNGDGLIGVVGAPAPCTANANEPCRLWQQLRAANLIAGNPALQGNAANPTHAYGGLVQGVVDGTQGNKTGRWLILSNIPGDVGARLDRDSDDGTYNTGTVNCVIGCTATSSYPLTGNVTVWVMM